MIIIPKKQKIRTKKTETCICVVCFRPFERFKKRNGSNGSIIGRKSNSKTCSSKCSRDYIKQRNNINQKERSAKNKEKLCRK